MPRDCRRRRNPVAPSRSPRESWSRISAPPIPTRSSPVPVFLLPERFVRLPLEATYAEAFAGLAYPFRAVLERTPTP